ncbi:hypothetical protein BJ742DRAFT_348954 [Cladochytrium replicatum]|nr:hypothetical protein BJ742DRAFT_348954 [Cladochytrium replicatum]
MSSFQGTEVAHWPAQLAGRNADPLSLRTGSASGISFLTSPKGSNSPISEAASASSTSAHIPAKEARKKRSFFDNLFDHQHQNQQQQQSLSPTDKSARRRSSAFLSIHSSSAPSAHTDDSEAAEVTVDTASAPTSASNSLAPDIPIEPTKEKKKKSFFQFPKKKDKKGKKDKQDKEYPEPSPTTTTGTAHSPSTPLSSIIPQVVTGLVRSNSKNGGSPDLKNGGTGLTRSNSKGAFQLSRVNSITRLKRPGTPGSISSISSTSTAKSAPGPQENVWAPQPKPKSPLQPVSRRPTAQMPGSPTGVQIQRRKAPSPDRLASQAMRRTTQSSDLNFAPPLASKRMSIDELSLSSMRNRENFVATSGSNMTNSLGRHRNRFVSDHVPPSPSSTQMYYDGVIPERIQRIHSWSSIWSGSHRSAQRFDSYFGDGDAPWELNRNDSRDSFPSVPGSDVQRPMKQQSYDTIAARPAGSLDSGAEEVDWSTLERAARARKRRNYRRSSGGAGDPGNNGTLSRRLSRQIRSNSLDSRYDSDEGESNMGTFGRRQSVIVIERDDFSKRKSKEADPGTLKTRTRRRPERSMTVPNPGSPSSRKATPMHFLGPQPTLKLQQANWQKLGQVDEADSNIPNLAALPAPPSFMPDEGEENATVDLTKMSVSELYKTPSMRRGEKEKLRKDQDGGRTWRSVFTGVWTTGALPPALALASTATPTSAAAAAAAKISGKSDVPLVEELRTTEEPQTIANAPVLERVSSTRVVSDATPTVPLESEVLSALLTAPMRNEPKGSGSARYAQRRISQAVEGNAERRFTPRRKKIIGKLDALLQQVVDEIEQDVLQGDEGTSTDRSVSVSNPSIPNSDVAVEKRALTSSADHAKSESNGVEVTVQSKRLSDSDVPPSELPVVAPRPRIRRGRTKRGKSMYIVDEATGERYQEQTIIEEFLVESWVVTDDIVDRMQHKWNAEGMIQQTVVEEDETPKDMIPGEDAGSGSLKRRRASALRITTTPDASVASSNVELNGQGSLVKINSATESEDKKARLNPDETKGPKELKKKSSALWWPSKGPAPAEKPAEPLAAPQGLKRIVSRVKRVFKVRQKAPDDEEDGLKSMRKASVKKSPLSNEAVLDEVHIESPKRLITASSVKTSDVKDQPVRSGTAKRFVSTPMSPLSPLSPKVDEGMDNLFSEPLELDIVKSLEEMGFTMSPVSAVKTLDHSDPISSVKPKEHSEPPAVVSPTSSSNDLHVRRDTAESKATFATTASERQSTTAALLTAGLSTPASSSATSQTAFTFTTGSVDRSVRDSDRTLAKDESSVEDADVFPPMKQLDGPPPVVRRRSQKPTSERPVTIVDVQLVIADELEEEEEFPEDDYGDDSSTYSDDEDILSDYDDDDDGSSRSGSASLYSDDDDYGNDYVAPRDAPHLPPPPNPYSQSPPSSRSRNFSGSSFMNMPRRSSLPSFRAVMEAQGGMTSSPAVSEPTLSPYERARSPYRAISPQPLGMMHEEESPPRQYRTLKGVVSDEAGRVSLSLEGGRTVDVGKPMMRRQWSINGMDGTMVEEPIEEEGAKRKLGGDGFKKLVKGLRGR